MNKIKIILLIPIVLLSCSKEEPDLRLSGFETPIITGYELRDESGSELGWHGTPNIRLGNESNTKDSEYFFYLYPNPGRVECAVNIKVPDVNATKYLWIVKAQYQDNTETLNLGSNTIHVGGTPLLETSFTFNTIQIDLRNFSEGYYRMYLKVDDQILYDNLVVSK